MQTTNIGETPEFCAADGENIWISTFIGGQVVQVQGSTGAVLGTWTGGSGLSGVLVAAGKVFVAGHTLLGNLYVIDPTLPPRTVTLAATNRGLVTTV
jgi:hypothetical protein